VEDKQVQIHFQKLDSLEEAAVVPLMDTQQVAVEMKAVIALLRAIVEVEPMTAVDIQAVVAVVPALQVLRTLVGL
jgi:hypothetical protein